MGIVKIIVKCLTGRTAAVQDVHHHKIYEQRRAALENLKTQERRFLKVLELEKQVSNDPALLKRVEHLKRLSRQDMKDARQALQENHAIFSSLSEGD